MKASMSSGSTLFTRILDLNSLRVSHCHCSVYPACPVLFFFGGIAKNTISDEQMQEIWACVALCGSVWLCVALCDSAGNTSIEPRWTYAGLIMDLRWT